MTAVRDPGNQPALEALPRADLSPSEAPKAQPLDKKMLGDMKDLVKALEDDLRVRSIEVPEAAAGLRAEYDEAVRVERARATYEGWGFLHGSAGSHAGNRCRPAKMHE